MEFYKLMVFHIIKVLEKDNARVLSILMFDENIKSMIFNILGSFVYFIMYNYVCVNCLCLQKVKLSLVYK